VKRYLAVLSLILVLAVGVATAFAVTAPNEKVACASATASTPAHVVGVDGTGVSTIPGDTATDTECVTVTADTVTTPGPTTTVVETVTAPAPTTTAAATTTVADPAPTYTFQLDSASADVACGTTPGTITCPVHKADLGGGMGGGDEFDLNCANYCRDTWVDLGRFAFGKSDAWDLPLRWQHFEHVNTSHFALVEIRQDGNAFSSGCSQGGNRGMFAIHLGLTTADHYELDVQGGDHPNDARTSTGGAVYTTVDAGPVDPVGEVHTWRFEVTWSWSHGSVQVFKDGNVVYSNLDRPVGWHYDCDGTTLATTTFRIQHGIYTHEVGHETLDSGGLRFFTP
jgi:hypothetical protein